MSSEARLLRLGLTHLSDNPELLAKELEKQLQAEESPEETEARHSREAELLEEAKADRLEYLNSQKQQNSKHQANK